MSTETAPPQPEDPFAEEMARHGRPFRLFDNMAREAVRSHAPYCERCAELIEAFDIELSRALINGTGPWA